jgi:ATP synthase F0 subunit b
MSRSRLKGLIAIGFVTFVLAGAVSAQESQDFRQRMEQRTERAHQAVEGSGGNANRGVAAILTNTTEQAAHTAESWGGRLGLGKDASFGISLAVNFAGIVLFCWALLKSRLPQAFRERTASIQKGIRDAQAASADASRRLADIEARLSKLDAEVAEIRQSADREAAAEEERIRQAAEHDKQRIIDGAEAEIDAIARNARRELKGYAASLAVDLAARRIHVDEGTDHVLVQDFVDQLGKDGH